MGAILMDYFRELTQAMADLAQNPKTLFVGQQVRFDGQRMHASFKDVPMERRIEMPVCEDFQLGFCAGLALSGFLPICVFPRMDFLIIAANQLVNHLDKFPLMFKPAPKVIIRTAVGATRPLDPGPQHTQNHVDALRMMLKTIPVIELFDEGSIASAYQEAHASDTSTIIVERMESY